MMENIEREVKPSKMAKGFGRIGRKKTKPEGNPPLTPRPARDMPDIEDMKEVKRGECNTWDKGGCYCSPEKRRCAS